MKLEKGHLIEVKIPNTEKPVQAIVLDIIATDMYEGDPLTIHIFYMHRKGSLRHLINADEE